MSYLLSSCSLLLVPLYMFVLECAILLGASNIFSFACLIKKKRFFRRSLWEKIIFMLCLVLRKFEGKCKGKK